MSNNHLVEDFCGTFEVGEVQVAVPEGEYSAMVTSIEKFKFAGKRDSLLFRFLIAEGPFQDAELKGFVNVQYKKFSAYSKFLQWHRKATGHELETGEMIKLGDFKSRVLRVKVETKHSKKTGNTFSNVTDILGLQLEL